MARLFTTAVCVMVLAALALSHAEGQTTWTPPRTPDGQPDIQGFWGEPGGGADGTNVETSFQTADTLFVQGWTKERIAARTPISAIVDTPDGRIPYQPWADARRRQILSRYGGDVITGKPLSPRDVNPDLFCMLGVPRLLYWQDFQVVQAPGYVVQSWERTHSARVIPLDGRPHPPSKVKTYMGISRGRWEGNTLVVETRNLRDWTWFDSKGTLHSDEMTMVERYAYVDRGTLDLRITFTDPQTLTRPFTMAWTLRREHADDPAYEILEYACAEGERARDVILE